MNETQTELTLAQKILRIQTEMGTVSKQGTNTFQRYKYAREVDIVNAVRPLLNKYGVIVIPELAMAPNIIDMEKQKLTTLAMKFKVVNADNPKDYYDTVIPAQGSDNGDKGVYKAITGAKKYFYANTFLIATDDDPEQDELTSVGRLKKTSTTKSKTVEF